MPNIFLFLILPITGWGGSLHPSGNGGSFRNSTGGLEGELGWSVEFLRTLFDEIGFTIFEYEDALLTTHDDSFSSPPGASCAGVSKVLRQGVHTEWRQGSKRGSTQRRPHQPHSPDLEWKINNPI